jgi:uncharacterized protein (UPF0147 family)
MYFDSFCVNFSASKQINVESLLIWLLQFYAVAKFMVRKKRLKEYEERIGQALTVLGEISEDTTTPRNIRRAAKNAIQALQTTEYTPAVRASNAVSILDEILQDPNMPPYTRVKLWNVMSLIEAIKD